MFLQGRARREVFAMTGSYFVPVLVLDDGDGRRTGRTRSWPGQERTRLRRGWCASTCSGVSRARAARPCSVEFWRVVEEPGASAAGRPNGRAMTATFAITHDPPGALIVIARRSCDIGSRRILASAARRARLAGLLDRPGRPQRRHVRRRVLPAPPRRRAEVGHRASGPVRGDPRVGLRRTGRGSSPASTALAALRGDGEEGCRRVEAAHRHRGTGYRDSRGVNRRRARPRPAPRGRPTHPSPVTGSER